LGGATDWLAEAVSEGFSSDGQAARCPGVVGVVGERNRALLIPAIGVNMDTKSILVPNQSIKQLSMPTNDEIDLTKAALDIGVQA
jgi:hypothetical protein